MGLRRRLAGAGRVVLLSVIQPLMLAAMVSAITQQAAVAQSAEAVGKIAEAITVRIEGATQGSGVLVKKEGNRYTVLTAWHVVEGQRPGEELAVITSDKIQHQMASGSLRRVGDEDLATLEITSPILYNTAELGALSTISTGSTIFVSGFPLATEAVPLRALRFLTGSIVSITGSPESSGYLLLYSNSTLPGMSGGPILNTRGEVVGIHGKGEIDAKMTEQYGIMVKTGTNLGVPITALSTKLGANTDSNHAHSGNPIKDSPIKHMRSANENRSDLDYSLELRNLRESLAGANYVDADNETRRILLNSSQRSDVLTPEAVELLSCDLLRRIDEEWTSHSRGLHGFRSQLSQYTGSYSDFEALVQWRRGGFLTIANDQGRSLAPGYFPRAVSNGPIHQRLLQRFQNCAKRQ